MDNDKLKFLDKINTCVKYLELATQLINMGDIYDDIIDYPSVIKCITNCIELVESSILYNFEQLLYPAIIQHIKNLDDRLDLVYINPETRKIYYVEKYYAEKRDLDTKEIIIYWQIHIAEYDPIMHSATIIHRQFQGQLNPPQNLDNSRVMLEEISTVNIKNYGGWLQQNI